jgi:glycosyltransferase involved in cell wall biosynthesis
VNTEALRPRAFHNPDELTALRARLGIPADRRLIVYLGLLAEYQGVGLLLEAMQQLVQRRPDAHLLLMGFANEMYYGQRAIDLGIGEHVTLTGRVPYSDAPTYLALGDVAAAPKLSLTEGAGKMLNYMAVGLPVVAFDTPVAREYLALDGIYAKPGDVNSLAQCLDSALPGPGPLDRYSQAGQRLRQRAVQAFGWESAGRQIVQVYARVRGEAGTSAVATPVHN